MTWAQAINEASKAALESGELIAVVKDPELAEHYPDDECYGYARLDWVERLYPTSPVLFTVGRLL